MVNSNSVRVHVVRRLVRTATRAWKRDLVVGTRTWKDLETYTPKPRRRMVKGKNEKEPDDPHETPDITEKSNPEGTGVAKAPDQTVNPPPPPRNNSLQ